MNEKFREPKFNESSFTCPHCQAIAQMDFIIPYQIGERIIKYTRDAKIYIQNNYNMRVENSNIQQLAIFYRDNAPTFAICQACQKINIWVDEEMIYPKPRLTPLPNEDLPDDIKADYEEASLIVQDSPRGACALLRLALQKLMIKLGYDKNIDKAIQNLVNQKIIDETMQKALDSVRVIGNSAAHPNELNINDNKDIAITLFEIINYIAERTLTSDRKINEIYATLPENAKRENRKN